MNKFFKISMFITSFIPLWITVVFIDVMSLVENTVSKWSEILGISFILFFLLFSIIIISVCLKQDDSQHRGKYIITEAVQEKGITSEFLLSYILPLFAFDFTQWKSVIQFLIYFSILAFLCVRNNNVYVNLIFELKNYKFYTCEVKWEPEPNVQPKQIIAISKKNLCANKGNSISAALLNTPFYITRD